MRLSAEVSGGNGNEQAEGVSIVGATPLTMDQHIEAAVERALHRVLGSYLNQPTPEPAVYTVAQAAIVMQVSEDTVSRLVRRRVLPRVPFLDGRILIPRTALKRLLAEPQPPDVAR